MGKLMRELTHDLMYDLKRGAAGWIMWSRRNFIIATVVLLAIVGLLGIVTSGGSKKPHPAVPAVIPATVIESGPGAILTEAPSSTPADTPTTSKATPSASPKTTALVPQPNSAVIDVTNKFMHAWVNQGQTTKQWRAAFAPYATARLEAQYAKTDVSAVPANIVSGRPVIIGAADGNVAVRTPVNGGSWVQVVVIHTSDGWLVDQVNDFGVG